MVRGIKFIFDERSDSKQSINGRPERKGKIFVRVSPLNFEKSFELYLKLTEFLEEKEVFYIQINLNDGFTFTTVEEDIAALLSNVPEWCSCVKDYVGLYDCPSLNLKFRIINRKAYSYREEPEYVLHIPYNPKNASAKNITTLVSKLYELGLIINMWAEESMSNLSQLKRERMLAFLQKIKDEHRDDDDMLIALGEIESELTSKKYGLVWEQHEEAVDVMMRDHIPVFTEVPEREITAVPSQGYNFILEGDNLHSLRLLEKTHKGRIDVIYIDPPYNTGNKDFVYDDVYVDDLDGFKHSKWISFMCERLRIARNLLTSDGVIVISIGYQEVHNLVVLCQEMFDTKQVTCVTVQTSGGKPNGGFNYVQEYLVFIAPRDFEPSTMNFTGGIERSPFEGLTLSTFTKVTRPNQAYPIFIDKKTMNIVGVGKTLTERINEGSYTGELEDFPFDYDEASDGTVALWPISSKGAECVWRLIPSRLKRDWEKGYIKVGKNKSKVNPNEFSVQYLPEGVIQKVESGELEVVGQEPNAPTLVFGKNKTVGSEIPTIWTENDFYTTKGTACAKDIFGDKRFSYPKPLELITEVLRAISKNDSIVLDFFAGSGTTGHAVIELNAEKHSNRRFILCTNNEGDICEKVTYPRIKTVITGKREDGNEYETELPANIKYYHTDFISKDDEYLSDALLEHIREMIQLEHGVKIDGSQYLMVMSDEEADELQKHWGEYEGVKAIYASKDVLFTTEQNELFAGVEIHTIPDYYFNFELKEVGEAW